MIMPAITQIHLASEALISGEKFSLALVCHTLHARINIAGDALRKLRLLKGKIHQFFYFYGFKPTECFQEKRLVALAEETHSICLN